MPTLSARSARRSWSPRLGVARVHSAVRSSADELVQGLALLHLHSIGNLPLHEKQHEMPQWWGFHGEAEKLTEAGGVLGRRRLLDGWR